MAHILIADDSMIVRKSYESMLAFMGHDVIICKDGEEALTAFIKYHPSLLILDIDMPGMNGIEACRAIRRLPNGISVPIIIVSALDEENDILDGLNAGANDYLVKPVKEAHLVAKMKSFLGISALHKKDFELARSHTVFAGKYRIERLLGYGVHSMVFLVSDISDNEKKYALKLLKENFLGEEMISSFIATAEKFRRLDSEFILKIYEVGKFSERIYLLLELGGDNLQKLLTHRRLTELEASQMGYDLVRAIKLMRDNNMVHLDIKPGNVLSGNGHYKLGDFGIVIPRPSATMPLHAEIWSTAGYISPEYLTMDVELSSLSDIYSLGITLYQAITGDNPFESDRPSVSMFRQVNLIPPPLRNYDAEISVFFSDTVLAMLEKKVSLRPSPEELQEIFARLVEYNRCREVNRRQCRSKEAVRDASWHLLEEQITAPPESADIKSSEAVHAALAEAENSLKKMVIFTHQTQSVIASSYAAPLNWFSLLGLLLLLIMTIFSGVWIYLVLFGE